MWCTLSHEHMLAIRFAGAFAINGIMQRTMKIIDRSTYFST